MEERQSGGDRGNRSEGIRGGWTEIEEARGKERLRKEDVKMRKLSALCI